MHCKMGMFVFLSWPFHFFFSFHFNLEDFSPKVQQIHVVEPTSRGPWTDGIDSRSHPLPIEIHVGHVGPCGAMTGGSGMSLIFRPKLNRGHDLSCRL